MIIETKTEYQITLTQDDMGTLRKLVHNGQLRSSEDVDNNDELLKLNAMAEKILGAK